MSFYRYRQSNPGGGFHYDPDRGLSVEVYIEADSAAQADERAERIGIYFDGVADHIDCNCCGDRWDRAHSPLGDDNPVDPDRIPAPEEVWVLDDNEGSVWEHKWLDPGEYEVFVHPAEGRFYGSRAEVEYIRRRVTGYGLRFSRFDAGGVHGVGDDGFTPEGNGPYPAPGSRSWGGYDGALVVNRDDLRVASSGVLFSDEPMYIVWTRDEGLALDIAERARAFVDALPKLDPDGILGL